VRIGNICGPAAASGNNYRSLIPLRALERRGHEIVTPDWQSGMLKPADAFSCDVVLVYRAMHREALQLVDALRARGIGVVWDNDDDFLHGPVGAKESAKAWRQSYRASVAAATRAHVVTVSTEPIAAIYREAGAADVRVVENLLHAELQRPRPRRHDGVVVGWIGGWEHENDARELQLADALRRVQDARPEVHVECIGVDLGLSERYRHDVLVDFDQLPVRMATWDIGLAPIAENPFNLARSDIKVKEYAACRLPWLASDRGPYASLGEAHGGRLVDDAGWSQAVDALVDDRRARKRLGKAGKAWSKTLYAKDRAGTYEAILEDAMALARRSSAERPGRMRAKTARR
jgi:glycosyltransferase involved in cell wall biosynthesis